MSGQQIGTVVGYGIGFYFGGPVGGQIGAAIGGYVGGVIDPTQINGPHIGDGQNQTSADGQPIAWILGTAPCVGNIMDNGPRFEVKKTEGGKGSTTETNTFEAHQTFAILICESCELRDSTIVGIQMVRCNGKIVYDVRPGSTMLAESAKWKQNVTFYFGGEDQVPDPDLEAIHGIGNTPSYRGICYAVFKNFNRSEFGDAIPQFEWVVVSEATSSTDTPVFQPGRLSEFTNAHFPLVDGAGDYVFSGFWNAGNGTGVNSPEFDSIAQVQAWAASRNAITGAAGTNVLGTPDFYVGYMARTDTTAGLYSTSTDEFDLTGTQPDVTDLESVLLLYQWVSLATYTTTSVDAMCSEAVLNGPWVGAVNGAVARKVPTETPGYLGFVSCGLDSLIEGIYPLCIQARRKRIAPAIVGHAVPDMQGWYVDNDGNLYQGYTETAGTFRVLSAASTTGTDPSVEYNRYELGPALRDDDPDYANEAMWTAAYDAAVLAGTMPAGLGYGADYPATVSSAWLEDSSAPPSLGTQTLSLSSIVQRINRRGGLTDSDIDVTELTDQVIGYPIAAQYNAADCIRPLAGCYFFKGSEYDGQIHFHKDGADAVVVVDPQDFINGEDEKDEDKRGQAKEYPRLLTGSYIDPTLDFAIGKSKAERRSPDVRAIGEASLQIPVVMAPNDAARATEKALKIMWSRLQGTRKFSLPYAAGDKNYLQMVPCIPFGLEGRRYVADQITLEDGQLLIEASYDRQSAYTSSVTAVPTLPPTPPASTIMGPTMFAAMNLPRLRSKDASPGMYLAACGLLSSWRGCMVQVSFDNGATFHDAVSITVPSVMGNLTADIGPTTEPIPVAIYNGELTSATDAQIANLANGFALLTDDDVPEVAQFQTQDETSPKHYDLTGVLRGGLQTLAVAHDSGERFVLLDNTTFLPIDIRYAGTTIVFRPVSYGTDPSLNATYSVVFDPQFTTGETFSYYTNAAGSRYTDPLGAFYFKAE